MLPNGNISKQTVTCLCCKYSLLLHYKIISLNVSSDKKALYICVVDNYLII